MKPQYKRVLVTGADGFIGSHLVESLVARGYGTRAFVQYNPRNERGWLEDLPERILEGLDVFAGDVRDAHGVRAAMEGCDAVVHLAALIGIAYSYHSPDMYVDTNVKGTLNVVQAARQLGVGRVVHASSSEVYGTAQFVPMTEAHPLVAQSPYAASKIAADGIALSFYHSFETPVVVVRPFNTYGPRQSARAVIPTIITQIAKGAGGVRLGSLEPTRDFSFVRDTVAGFVAALESDRAVGETINLGSGFEVRIGDTLKLIAELMGAAAEPVMEAVRLRPANSEVNRLLADNSKARRLLDWHPEFAGMEGFRRGLAETIGWFMKSENLNGYKSDRYNL